MLAVCDAPQVDDDATCDQPELQEPASTTEVDPELTGAPNLRRVDALVNAGADLVVGAGSYGDFFGEGAFLVALGPDDAVVWSESIPTTATEITAVHAAGDADGVWIAAAQDDDTTIARHYDAAGMMTGELVVADFTATSILAQPMGAVAMTGTSGGDAAYVGVAADGTENYNGTTNQAEGPYVLANGAIEFHDGPGAAVWELDPRGTPPAGFPLEVGAESAIITTSGAVLAVGEVFGPLGDNTLLVRADADGDQVWSLGRPRALAETVLEGAMDTAIIIGQSNHCSRSGYLAVVDIAGAQLQEVRIEAPPRPWVSGLDGTVTTLRSEGNVLQLLTYAVEVQAP